MNEYNFDYMNYVTSIPSSNKMNYNKEKDKYNVQMLKQISPQMMNFDSYNNQILDPKEGFIRGNLFQNLYDGYKNYTPQEINPQNEREALLNQWQQYHFAIVDLNLYLDIYPNDTNALRLYNNYNNILKQIKTKYESMYGPLTISSNQTNQNSWTWINSPWPWEGGM